MAENQRVALTIGPKTEMRLDAAFVCSVAAEMYNGASPNRPTSVLLRSGSAQLAEPAARGHQPARCAHLAQRRRVAVA